MSKDNDKDKVKGKDTEMLFSNLNSKEITDENAVKMMIRDFFKALPLELEITKKVMEDLKCLLNTKPKIFTTMTEECCKYIEDEFSEKPDDKNKMECKLIYLCKLLISIFHSEFQSSKEIFLLAEDISIITRILELLTKLLFLPNFTILIIPKDKTTNTELRWFAGSEVEDKLLHARRQIIKTLIALFSRKLYKIDYYEFTDPYLMLFLSHKNENNLISASFLNSIIYPKTANLKGSNLKEALELSSSACNLCYLLLITKGDSKYSIENIPKWAEKIIIIKKTEANEKEMGINRNFYFRNFFAEYISGLTDMNILNDIIQGIIYNINESFKNFGLSHILKSNINFLLCFLNETQVINILGKNDFNLNQIWISLSSIFKKALEESTPSNEDLSIQITMIYESLSQNKYFSAILNGQNKIKENLNNNKSSYADMFYTFLFEVIDLLKIHQEKIALSLLSILGNTSYFILTLNKTTSNVMANYFSKVLNDKGTNEIIKQKYLYQLFRIYYGLLKFHYYGNLEVACSLFPLVELLENLFPKDNEIYKSNPYFKIIFSYLDYYNKGFGIFPPVEYLEQTAFQGIIPDDFIEMEMLKENDDKALKDLMEIVFWNNIIMENPIDLFDFSIIKRIPIRQK